MAESETSEGERRARRARYDSIFGRSSDISQAVRVPDAIQDTLKPDLDRTSARGQQQGQPMPAYKTYLSGNMIHSSQYPAVKDRAGLPSQDDESTSKSHQTSPSLGGLFSAASLEARFGVVGGATYDNPSASYIAFWGSEKVEYNIETYIPLEASRKVFSIQRKEDMRRQRERDIDELQKLHEVYRAHSNCSGCRQDEVLFHRHGRMGQWVWQEQGLTHQERSGEAYVSEQEISDMRINSWNVWSSEESDRAYKLCDAYHCFERSKWCIQNSESYWIDGGKGGLYNYLTAEWPAGWSF